MKNIKELIIDTSKLKNKKSSTAILNELRGNPPDLFVSIPSCDCSCHRTASVIGSYLCPCDKPLGSHL